MLINNFIYLIASLFSLSAGERERERDTPFGRGNLSMFRAVRRFMVIINTVALSPSQNSNRCVTRECATRFHLQLILLC
jgi:hypothetical protein